MAKGPLPGVTSLRSKLPDSGKESGHPLGCPFSIKRTLPSAAYMTLTNTSAQARRLVAISSTQARAIEVHESIQVDGMWRMRRLAEVTGGRYVSTKKVAELYDPTKKYMLMDGIRPDDNSDQEDNDSDPISL